MPGKPPPASSLRTLSALRVARYRQTGTLPGCPLNAQQKRNARLAASNSITGALFFSTKNTVVLLGIRQFPLRETEFEAGFFAKETAPEHLPPEGSPSNCVGTSRKLACGRVGDAIRGRGGKYSGAYRFNQRRPVTYRSSVRSISGHTIRWRRPHPPSIRSCRCNPWRFSGWGRS